MAISRNAALLVAVVIVAFVALLGPAVWLVLQNMF
jgi:hypothetical protein